MCQQGRFFLQEGGQLSSSSEEQGVDIPTFAKFWCHVYFMIPKVNFPGTRLHVSFTVATVFFLMSVGVTSARWLQIVFGWPFNESMEAGSDVAGAMYSSLLWLGVLIAFQTHRYNPSEHITQAPQWWQALVDALVQFCTGYMIYDGCFIVYTRWNPSVSWIPSFVFDDYLFLGHHLMVITYTTQTRMYRAGHMSAMMCMFLGEASDPAMNIWYLTSKAIQLDCCNGPMMQAWHKYNEIIFCAIYLFCRVFMGPLICTCVSWNLLTSSEAKQNVPFSIRLQWNFMIWAVIIGSYSWIIRTYEMLQVHMVKRSEQEL